jgi:glyoxylase-like metal-dependent hydrolase (beta-lactamase superfamily II)
VLRLGGTEIQILMLGRSHTGGDLVVYLPAQKTLFMSETYLHRMFPSLASGYPTEWIAAIKNAQAMDVDVYVPGHGFVDSPAILKTELDTFSRALETVVAEGKRPHDAGVLRRTRWSAQIVRKRCPSPLFWQRIQQIGATDTSRPFDATPPARDRYNQAGFRPATPVQGVFR